MAKRLGKRIVAAIVAVGMVITTNGFTGWTTAKAETQSATYTYQSETSALGGIVKIASGSSIAMVYKAAQNSDTLTSKEWLTQRVTSVEIPAVTCKGSVTCNIQIYTDVADGDDPTKGTPVFSTPYSTTAGKNSNVVELDNNGEIAVGTNYSIVLTFISSGDESISLLSYEDTPSVGSYVKNGETWSQQEDASGVDLDFDITTTTIGILSDLSKATVTVSGKKAYTGSDIELDEEDISITYPCGKQTLSLSAGDYTLSYEDNVKVGDQAKVTFFGDGYFKPETSKSANFSIRYDLSSGLSISTKGITYTGEQIQLSDYTYSLDYENTKASYKNSLTANDYTLGDYENNVNAGKASVTVRAKDTSSLYMGSGIVTFDIASKPISDASIVISPIADQIWNNNVAITLDDQVILTDNKRGSGVVLQQNQEYTILNYANNEIPGTATITITGKGNYSGTTRAHFAIKDSQGNLGVELADPSATLVYTGAEIKPEIYVFASNYATSMGGAKVSVGDNYNAPTYSNNINAGQASVAVTGKTGSDWEGQRATHNFTIEPKNVADADVNVTVNGSYTYNGTAQTPKLTITYNGLELTEKDYSISCTENTKAGEATATITGKGNYTGTRTITFTIAPKSLTSGDISVASIAKQPFNPNGAVEVDPTITDTATGKKLVKDEDYTCTYSNNTTQGTATITITGMGNYADVITASYNIGSRSIDSKTNSEIKVEFASLNYHGYSAFSSFGVALPNVKVSDNGKALKKSEDNGTTGDYLVSYPDSNSVGTKNISVSGINNYEDTDTSLTYQIVYDLSTVYGKREDGTYQAADKYAMNDLTYTGEDLIDAVDANIVVHEKDPDTGEYVDKELVKGIDYTCEVYASKTSNTKLTSLTEAGTYYVLIKPTDNSRYMSGNANVRHALSVTKIYLTDYTVKASVTNTYTGHVIPFEDLSYQITFEKGGKEARLVEGVDYSVAGVYASTAGDVLANVQNVVDTSGNNIIYYLKLVGVNNVLGEIYVPFNLQPKHIGSESVSVMSINTVLYEKDKSTFYPDSEPVVKDLLSDETSVILRKGIDYTVSYDNIDKVGTAIVTFTGNGNYTGSRVAYYRICYNVVDGAIYIKGDPTVETEGKHFWTVDAEDTTDLTYNYTGEEIKLGTIDLDDNGGDLEVRYTYVNDQTVGGADNTSQLNGQEIFSSEDQIDENADYILDYTANKDLSSVGVKEVTLRGVNRFTGSKKIYYRVVGKLTGATVNYTSEVAYVDAATGVYPDDLEVMMGDTRLIEGVDYRVEYSNNTTVGYQTAILKIIGIGNFEGTITKSYSIGYDLGAEGDTTFSDIEKQSYSGSEVQVAGVSVSYKGTLLTEGSNYTVSYENNIEAGEASYVVNAIMSPNSLYVGKAKASFIISRSINGESVSATIDPISPQAYTGATITLDAEDIHVYFENDDLVYGQDYTLSYSNNVNVGSATVTVTGMGAYIGEKSTTFPIRYDLGDGHVQGKVADAEYTSNALQPAITSLSYLRFKEDGSVLINANLLTSLSEGGYANDCTTTYTNNVAMGTGQMVVAAKPDSTLFMGYAVVPFNITPKDIGDSSVTVSAPNQTWNHNELLEPIVEVTDQGTTLVENVDYYVVYDELLPNYSYSDNRIPGTGKVKVYGMGNYKGSVIGTFTIEDSSGDLTAEFADSFAEGQGASYDYTGQAILPELKIYANSYAMTGIKVKEGVDYTITYQDNVEVGTAHITITGVEGSRYEGQSIDLTFQITPLDISKATIVGVKDQVWTGGVVVPERIVVSVGETVLTEDVDYSLHFEGNNIDVGHDTAYVTIKALDGRNVTGSTSLSYSIGYDISEVALSINEGEGIYTYDGSQHKPSVTVLGGQSANSQGVQLVEGEDYTISYVNNVNAGGYEGDTDASDDPTIVISGTGLGKCYVGSISKSFVINQADLSSVKAKAIASQERTGSEINPGITMTYKKMTLKEGKDISITYQTQHTDVGTVRMEVAGIGNYKGTYKTNFEITPSQLTNDKITAALANPSEKSVNYQKGKAYTPEVIVTDLIADQQVVLKKGTDYQVSYLDNEKAGQATVRIQGLGQYTGETELHFDIYASLLDDATFTYEPVHAYTGSAIKPDLKVECGGNILKKGTDYKVTYEDNTNVGTASMRIEAVNGSHYWNNVIKEFAIKDSIETAYVDTDSYATSYVYTGSAIKLDADIYADSTKSKKLVEGVDYTISYEDNINVTQSSDKRGKAIITGIGNYTGSRVIRYWINQLSINTLSFNKIADAAYNGKAKTPKVTIKNNGIVLKEGKDYSISYVDNTKCGIAKIVITGYGNYYGTNTIRFKIAPGKVSSPKVTKVSDTTMTLSWDKVTGASGYEVWTSDNKTKLGSVSAKTSLKLTNLQRKKYYKLTVRAYVLQNGVKSYGPASKEIAKATLPKAATFAKTTTGKGKVTLTWSKVSANGYVIYVSSKKNGTYKKLKTISKSSTLSYTDTKGKVGSTRYYKIRTFAKVNGKTIYSSLSSAKKVKVK